MKPKHYILSISIILILIGAYFSFVDASSHTTNTARVKGNATHDPARRTFGTSFKFKVDLTCDLIDPLNSFGDLEVELRGSIGRDKSESSIIVLQSVRNCWIDDRTGALVGLGIVQLDGESYTLRFSFIDNKDGDEVQFGLFICDPLCGFPLITLSSNNLKGNFKIT